MSFVRNLFLYLICVIATIAAFGFASMAIWNLIKIIFVSTGLFVGSIVYVIGAVICVLIVMGCSKISHA